MDNNNPNIEPDQPLPASPPPQPVQPQIVQPQQPINFGQPQDAQSEPAQQSHNFNPQPQQQPLPGQPVQPQQLHEQSTGQSDTLGLISIIMAFFIPLVGFILGLVGRSKAKKAGYSGKLSLIGIILNAVFMVFGILVFVFLILASFQGAQTVARDVEVKTNVNSVYQKLEEFHNNNGYYPEEIVLEDLKGIDPTIVDTVNNDSQYQYSASGCLQSKCRAYTIGAELETEDSFGNKIYQKQSLN